MNLFKKMWAVILSLTMICGCIPYTARAVESDNIIAESAEINSEYLAEMKDMGFSETDVLKLYDWNLRVANANSVQEVDALMDEYQILVADTPLARSAVSTSFSTNTGGTLNLDYTGSFSLWSNVIFTKVIYMPSQQVSFYQHAMNSEGLIDYISDELLGAGISIVSSSVAAQIASYLGVSVSLVTWLVGQSLGLTVWMLQNLDKWEFSDAFNQSTTGKLKLEFFYLQSTIDSNYVEIENFEPWNNSLVEVPEDYDYTWYADVYDFDGTYVPCEHTYGSWASINEDEHSRVCNNCGHIETISHSYRWTSMNTYLHRGICSACGEIKEESHAKNYDELIGLCKTCGYKGSISIPIAKLPVTVLNLPYNEKGILN